LPGVPGTDGLDQLDRTEFHVAVDVTANVCPARRPRACSEFPAGRHNKSSRRGCCRGRSPAAAPTADGDADTRRFTSPGTTPAPRRRPR
jgi:hypothetical protein